MHASAAKCRKTTGILMAVYDALQKKKHVCGELYGNTGDVSCRVRSATKQKNKTHMHTSAANCGTTPGILAAVYDLIQATKRQTHTHTHMHTSAAKCMKTPGMLAAVYDLLQG